MAYRSRIKDDERERIRWNPSRLAKLVDSCSYSKSVEGVVQSDYAELYRHQPKNVRHRLIWAYTEGCRLSLTGSAPPH